MTNIPTQVQLAATGGIGWLQPVGAA